jgi:rhodanese-related sulfurtransferase
VLTANLESGVQLMQHPNEPFRRIGVEEAKRLIDEGKVRVVDVRQPDEWQAGHIPVANHIPLDKIVNKPTESLEGDLSQPTLFVCAVGGRSAIACEVAATMGFTELYNLEGGTTAWIRSGLAVDKGD